MADSNTKPAFDADFADFNPNDSDDDDAIAAAIRRLADLDPVAYDRARKQAAKELGCTVSTLDSLVRRERATGADTKGPGRPLQLPTPQPWPQPVNGAALLCSLARYFSRHLVLPPGAADVIALWAVHCHCFDAFRWTPRLQFKAPTKNAGKSTALELLKEVVPRALETESISQAALFRAIELARPTVLMDEANVYLREDRDLRAMVNAGAKAGGQATRCVGEDQEVRMFSCHGPIALAGIGNLPGDVESRALKIIMRRRLRTEPIRPIDDLTKALGSHLARKAARWVHDHMDQLRAARPDMGGLINRDADNWRPLYAIADLAGGEWPQRVRAAQRALRGADDDDSDSLGEQVLADIRAVFNAWVVERPGTTAHEMSSAALVKRLVDMEGRPWTEMPGRRGGPLTAARLARLLHPFKVQPCQIGPEHRERGYRLLDFADAFDRHLTD